MQRVSVLLVPQLPPQQQNSTILQLLTFLRCLLQGIVLRVIVPVFFFSVTTLKGA
jgi:hypothetical protein